MQLTPWSERHLAFGKPEADLPVLLERVKGTAARLAQLTGHVPRERLTLRAHGSWCVVDHIGHLIYMQDRFEERLDDFAARRDHLCWIDLGDQEPELARHRSQDLGDLIEEFRLKRGYFTRRLEAFESAILRHRAFHPCRKISMTPVDMVLFLAEHDDHHLVSIRRLLALD